LDVIVVPPNAEFSTVERSAKLSTISDRQSRLDARRRRLHVNVTSLPPPCDVIVAPLLTSSVVVVLSPSSEVNGTTCIRVIRLIITIDTVAPNKANKQRLVLMTRKPS